jgi:hypothetical protein
VTVDRFFRGISNRIRGEQAQAASRGEDAGGADYQSPALPQTDSAATTFSADTSDDTAMSDDDAGNSTPDDGAGSDDEGADSDLPASGGEDDYTIIIPNDGGSNEGSVTQGDDGWSFTISDGDDGSVIIANPGGNESGSSANPEPEPDPYPEPEPEPDEATESGTGQDVDDVYVPDGDLTPVEGDRPDVARPDNQTGTESAGSISAAEAVRAGLVTPEDLRVQPTIDVRGSFAGLVNSSDDDDDAMLAPRDEFIEIPKVENQPAPGSGPPSPQLMGEARRTGENVAFQRGGIENSGSNLPPVPAEGTTYTTMSESGTNEEDGDKEEQDQTSEHTEVVGILDQDGNVVWHANGWWATTDDPEGALIWRSGSSGGGPNVNDGVWDGGGYWAYLDDEVVWVAGPDGEGPSEEPPEYTPSYTSEDFGYGDPFDLSGSGSDDASSEPLPAADEEEGNETDGATTDGEDASETEPPLAQGDYVVGRYDEDGNLIVSHSSSEGYWLFPGGPDGEPEWHGEGDPTFDPPNPSWWPVPEVDEGPADNDPLIEDDVTWENDDSDDPGTPSGSELDAPAFEPLPMYTIGDPVPAAEQAAGINPADLRVSTGPDLNQFIDTERLQERLAQNSEGDLLAPDEIERPTINLERAPGEGPPVVGSLDVMGGTVQRTSSTGGNVLEGPEEEEELPQVWPNLDLERAPVVDIALDPALNVGKAETLAGDSEAGEPGKTNPDLIAGDSEAGEPSKIIDSLRVAEIPQSTSLEFVETPEIARMDAPINFQSMPVIEQHTQVEQVETAIPAAIDPQPAIAAVEPGFSVEVQPLITNENVAGWELLSNADDPADDDDDPADGM